MRTVDAPMAISFSTDFAASPNSIRNRCASTFSAASNVIFERLAVPLLLHGHNRRHFKNHARKCRHAPDTHRHAACFFFRQTFAFGPLQRLFRLTRARASSSTTSCGRPGGCPRQLSGRRSRKIRSPASFKCGAGSATKQTAMPAVRVAPRRADIIRQLTWQLFRINANRILECDDKDAGRHLRLHGGHILQCQDDPPIAVHFDTAHGTLGLAPWRCRWIKPSQNRAESANPCSNATPHHTHHTTHALEQSAPHHLPMPW